MTLDLRRERVVDARAEYGCGGEILINLRNSILSPHAHGKRTQRHSNSLELHLDLGFVSC